MLPNLNTTLAYDTVVHDLNNDGLPDVVTAGVPTALIMKNLGNGKFKDITFADRPEGGVLPFTGYHPGRAFGSTVAGANRSQE